MRRHRAIRASTPGARERTKPPRDMPVLAMFSVRPCPALRMFVDRIWAWESKTTGDDTLPTLLPGTGAELFIHTGAPFQCACDDGVKTLDGAHLTCVRKMPLRLQSSKPVEFLAVRFRAGAVHRFTKVPGIELVDETPSAQDLWGASAVRLHAAVREARSPGRKVAAVEDFLLRNLHTGRTDELVEHATRQLYERGSDLPIDTLAEECGLSRRALERRFKGLTGQRPIEVRRLSRLQKAMRQLFLHNDCTTLDAALAHGFYDQSHFYREFRALGLESPVQYLAAARCRAHFYKTPLG